MSMNHSGNAYAQRLADMSRTPATHKVDPKVYYHQHNYAKFHFDMGGSNVKSVSFANYVYITDDKREQDQLDLVADAPGSFIYTARGSEAEKQLLQFLSEEQSRAIMATAQAQAAVSNQQFDPNAPIIPVQTQPVGRTPGLQVTPMPLPVAPQQGGVGVVGMQNSFSGTQATEQLTGVGAGVVQEKPPVSAAEAAIARINAMAAGAGEQKQG